MNIQKFYPIIGTISVGLLSSFTDSIKAWVAGHPSEAVLVATILGAILHFMPSPAGDVTPKS